MASKRGAGGLRLDATTLTATASMTINIDDEVAELSRALFAIDQLAPLHDGTADPSANRQHHDIAEVTPGAQSRFADQSHAAVVYDRDRPCKRSRNHCL
jgi:hypothetical protein